MSTRISKKVPETKKKTDSNQIYGTMKRKDDGGTAGGIESLKNKILSHLSSYLLSFTAFAGVQQAQKAVETQKELVASKKQAKDFVQMNKHANMNGITEPKVHFSSSFESGLTKKASIL